MDFVLPQDEVVKDGPALASVTQTETGSACDARPPRFRLVVVAKVCVGGHGGRDRRNNN